MTGGRASAAGPRDLGRIIVLALADARHEWRASLCLVLALAAVLAPLLVLFGLRFGVVQTLTDRLAHDVRNLEIVPIGAGRFDRAWFDKVKAWPEVAFAIPRTRAIAASIDLIGEAGRPVNVELVSSDGDDPLRRRAIVPEALATAAKEPDRPAPGAPPHLIAVQISGSVARKITMPPPNGILVGIVGRSIDGRQENVRVGFRVTAIIPEDIYSRDALFVPLAFLDATESFRDGFAEPSLGAEGPPRPDGERLYAGFRLYGRTIYDIPKLRDRLLAEKIEVATRAAEIEQLMSLDRNLGLLFWLIAGIGTAGFLLSLGVSLWGAVERKRRDLALMRLLGFRRRATIAFPVVQAGAIAVLGAALALLAFTAVASIINRHFASSLGAGETACRLLPLHVGVAVVATLACAVAASALAGARVARIEPSDGLREL
ncbi:MAG TPA: FtsX-like permease family protein [Vineibacter sp.]|nr:FtsX-like permease family protein [Vineibacter sp.]